MSTKERRKQKPMSEAEYIQTFCQEKRIRNRWAVYVSTETHQELLRMTSVFKDHYVTAMSLADAILSHHFEVNGELLTRLCNEDDKRTLNDLRTYAEKIDDEYYDEEE